MDGIGVLEGVLCGVEGVGVFDGVLWGVFDGVLHTGVLHTGVLHTGVDFGGDEEVWHGVQHGVLAEDEHGALDGHGHGVLDEHGHGVLEVGQHGFFVELLHGVLEDELQGVLEEVLHGVLLEDEDLGPQSKQHFAQKSSLKLRFSSKSIFLMGLSYSLHFFSFFVSSKEKLMQRCFERQESRLR